jgi:hypothetical protein
METRKDIILKKYVKMFNYASQHFEGVFPNPTEVDISEILFGLSTYFIPFMPEYRKPIKQGLRMMGIKLSPEQFELHYNIIYDDLHDLCLFIKNQK